MARSSLHLPRPRPGLRAALVSKREPGQALDELLWALGWARLLRPGRSASSDAPTPATPARGASCASRPRLSPIFSSFVRIVAVQAWATSVPCRANRRKLINKAKASAASSSRSWLAWKRWQLARRPNRSSCASLIRFSASPRAQYLRSYSALGERFRSVTMKRGLAPWGHADAHCGRTHPTGTGKSRRCATPASCEGYAARWHCVDWKGEREGAD